MRGCPWLCTSQVLQLPGMYSSKREGSESAQGVKEKVGDAGQLFRKAAGGDCTCDCHGTLEVTQCEQGVNVGDV